jgi:phosphoglycerol transferase MdoB-like AlkP superfamily enzyme
VTRTNALPPLAIAACRGVNALFCFAVAAYCVLTYSPFAYGMFIKPDVVPALSDFVTLSPWLFLVTLLLTTLTVMPQLRGAPGSGVARVYIAAGALAAVWLFTVRPMASLGNTPRALAFGVAALLPAICLALIDHRIHPSPDVTATGRPRLAAATLTTAFAAWILYAVQAPLRLEQAVGIDLPARAFAIGAASAFVLDFFVFSALALALLALAGVSAFARRSGAVEYWLFVGLLGLCASLTLALLVCAAIGVNGGAAWLASTAIGAGIAIVWADMARLRHGAASPGTIDSLELFSAPVAGIRSRAGLVTASIAIIPLSYLFVTATAHFDWNFLLQKLSVLIVWLMTFAVAGAALSRPSNARLPAAVIAAAFFAYHGLQWAERQPQAGAQVSMRAALDRYAALDPSFHLIRDAQAARSVETAEYYAFLQAHTLVLPRSVQTPATPFADAFAAPARRPDIFLFVIDSMRRDYVSPYNPAVTFTPQIAKLAAESYVFDRAFTRYSGTALAVPSMWAGGMVIHAIEQPSFDRRNTLLPLLDADGYRQIMDVDNVVEEFLPRDSSRVKLDQGRGTMEFDVCTTMGELEQRVEENAGRKPIFFYQLPQNVHIAIAARRKVPEGESYPGFFAPVASAIRRVDGCLGSFVDFLKRTNRFDDSIIILTSDHGDSLGEEGRWGHAYFIVPEVMRVPLIVHLPSWMREGRAADLSAVAFTTDLAPSLYALLGHEPKDRGSLFGRPLFVAADADESWRRRQRFLLASSYGAVYGMLAQNGRRMFVVDAVDGRDALFEMNDAPGEGLGRQLELTQATSADGRAFIRAQIEALAGMYRYTPAAGAAAAEPR